MTRRSLPVFVARMRTELERIEQTVASLEATQGTPRDPAHLALCATLLHSFYNGVERCLDLVARDVDEHRPAGPTSHRELLDQLAVGVPGVRDIVLAPAARAELQRFLDFRHRFRHLYFFDLSWKDVEPIVTSARPLWDDVHARLQALLSALESLVSPPTT